MKVRDELHIQYTIHELCVDREFIHMFGKLTHSKPVFLREAYHRLTGDCSASSNLTEEEVDQRIAQLVDSEDPDLVQDLRSNNEGRPDCCKKCYTDTAVDDRHHETVMKESDVITQFHQCSGCDFSSGQEGLILVLQNTKMGGWL